MFESREQGLESVIQHSRTDLCQLTTLSAGDELVSIGVLNASFLPNNAPRGTRKASLAIPSRGWGAGGREGVIVVRGRIVRASEWIHLRQPVAQVKYLSLQRK